MAVKPNTSNSPESPKAPDSHDDRDPNDDGPEAGFASPACFAHEVDPAYFEAPRPVPADELVTFLNTLLEAERAGAKTIAYYLNDAPEGPLKDALHAVGRDEARYAALLTRLVRQSGGEPSLATGSFFAKAKALADQKERLQFLNRGQGWVVRKLAEMLPRLSDPAMREALAEMHATHVANIRACERLIS
ncbi:MAG TPA: DUF6306 domain-containing protein [Candidatus Cybelea sp.]|nr:DUF6306 domain-containing protein [Candidatus Cybelea sp.]